MKKSNHKKSGNFLFLIGMFPIAMVFVAFLVASILFMNTKTSKKMETTEVEKEIVHDTVYVKCVKHHCDDIPKVEVRKKKVETKLIDTTPKIESMPAPVDPIVNQIEQ